MSIKLEFSFICEIHGPANNDQIEFISNWSWIDSFSLSHMSYQLMRWFIHLMSSTQLMEFFTIFIVLMDLFPWWHLWYCRYSSCLKSDGRKWLWGNCFIRAQLLMLPLPLWWRISISLSYRTPTPPFNLHAMILTCFFYANVHMIKESFNYFFLV